MTTIGYRVDPANATRWWAVLAVVLLVWCLLQALYVRPDGFGVHWRQAETMSIADEYRDNGLDLLHPRVVWRGDGEGFVEAELMLYPALVALAGMALGDGEWVAQCVSICLGALVALLLFACLLPRLGGASALLAAGLWLTSRLGVELSVACMPDVLSVAFYVAAIWGFVGWRDTRRRSAFWLSMVALVCAAAIKPHGLHLGIAMFVTLALTDRAALRSALPWIGWAFVLVVSFALLGYSAWLGSQTGNSFGVLTGDTKFPSLSKLVDPQFLKALATVSLEFGFGWVGIVALLVLLVRRRLDVFTVTLAAANLIGLLVGGRYASQRWLGAHYHAFSVIAAAWCVAHAVAALRKPQGTSSRVGLVAVVLFAAFLPVRYWLHATAVVEEHGVAVAHSPIPALAAELDRLLDDGQLVIVRSEEKSFDETWERVDNYQDPRLLYLAGAHGWVVAWDADGPELVRELSARGARFYVEPRFAEPRVDAPLQAWLAEHGELVVDHAAGRIWALSSR